MYTSALYPASYFPPLSYMISLVREKSVTIEIHETFPKQTLRNRTVIPTANGIQILSVPLTRPNGTHSKTSEIEVAYHERWNINHWRTFVTAYNASPFFLYYSDALERLLLQQHYDKLIDLDRATTSFLLKALKLDTELHNSQQYVPAEECTNDHRLDFSYKDRITQPAPPVYNQVFGDRQPFTPFVSTLDLLFNLGPEAHDYLLSAATNTHRT